MPNVTEMPDVAGVHRTKSGPTGVRLGQGSTLPCHLAWYGKLLLSHSQPALIYHGVPRLHQLHHPELPVLPLGTIDRSASPDHLFQPSWVGAGPAPDQTVCTLSHHVRLQACISEEAAINTANRSTAFAH
jgi:hypothetical protein